MAAGAWVLHDKAKEYLGDATIDLDADSFKCILCTSATNIATTSINGYAAVSNELSTANGYTAGGAALTSVTWTESGGTVTFDCANITWTATPGALTARFAGVYDDTVSSPVADPVMCHSLLDTTPADVTADATKVFEIRIASTGMWSF